MDNEENQQQQLQQQQLLQPLTNRSTNTHLSTTSTTTEDNEKGMPLKEDGLLRPAQVHLNQHYVSPSDGIMSPCTKKLSDLKGKRFKKAAKPQTLFAKTIQKRSLEHFNNKAESGGESLASPEGDGESMEK